MSHDPYTTIKRSLQTYPSLYRNVFSVLEHIFLTNGNGYDIDRKGNLVCPMHSSEKPSLCLTAQGLAALRFDFLDCQAYHFYPINDYDYEVKAMGGKQFYTDLYHYPNLNLAWQAAARWFMWQVMSRDRNWWKRHYRALDANPARQSLHGKAYHERYERALSVQKHMGAFIKRFGIKLDFMDAHNWEAGFLLSIPERKRG